MVVFSLRLEKRDYMEPVYNVTLNCIDCENTSCRIGDIIYPHEHDGCIREVPESIYLNYYHLLNEVWPFCKNDDIYLKLLNAADDVYKCKIIDKNGHHFVPKQLS